MSSLIFSSFFSPLYLQSFIIDIVRYSFKLMRILIYGFSWSAQFQLMLIFQFSMFRRKRKEQNKKRFLLDVVILPRNEQLYSFSLYCFKAWGFKRCCRCFQVVVTYGKKTNNQKTLCSGYIFIFMVNTFWKKALHRKYWFLPDLIPKPLPK